MRLCKQDGYALILVLLTITIIGIMIPTLSGSIINNAKQTTTIEERKLLTKLTEMGMIYFRNYKNKLEIVQREEFRNQLRQFVQMQTPIWRDQYLQGRLSEADILEEIRNKKRQIISNFENELNRCFTSPIHNVECLANMVRPKPVTFTEKERFQFSFEDISITSGDYFIDLGYRSVATNIDNNNTEQTEQEVLRIEYGDINVPVEIIDEDEENDEEDVYHTNCPTSGVYYGNCQYNSYVVITGRLTIYGKVIFANGVLITPGARLNIYGDTNFHNPLNVSNGARVFIQGRSGENVEVCFNGGTIDNGARVVGNGKRITTLRGGCY